MTASEVVDKINADGGEAIFVRTDVGESAQVIDMFARIEEAFGRVDIVHNNAIWFRHGPGDRTGRKGLGRHLKHRPKGDFPRR